jgi:D-xylose transport system ATP-binding protein
MEIIEIKNVSIEFPGVKALDHVSFSIRKGQIMALCGENGAGKSTLGKIIAGVNAYGSYTGDVFVNGETIKLRSTLDAEKRGIAIVHQELNSVYDMTVAENIFLGNYPSKRGLVDYKKMNQDAQALLNEVGLQIDPRVRMRDLTVSMMQMVEIAKAIALRPQVLIFDEATSSLTDKETAILFGIIRQLKAQEVTMVYVSHKMNEVFAICDAITVLKDGAFVLQAEIKDISRDKVIRSMVGRELKDMYPPRPTEIENPETILSVRNWTAFDTVITDKIRIHDVSFDVRRGEILGLYGLVGAGRTELVQSLFEGKAVRSTGEIWLEGQRINISHASDSIKHGIGLATENRKQTGLVMTMSVRENITLASLHDRIGKWVPALAVIDTQQENDSAQNMVEKLNVKVPHHSFNVMKLSGGNQQKVVLSKWLLAGPKILILDEPTRGIDVGAKSEIYKILRELADQGLAVIMISSEMPEIIGVADRILVMREGTFVGELNYGEVNEELLVTYAMGGVINE